MNNELVEKINRGEELTTDESIAMLTSLISNQDGQIRTLSKANNHLTEVIDTHEKAIVELQNAIVQLQRMHEADRRGQTDSGIILDPNMM